MHVDTYGRNEDGSLAEAGTELSGLDRYTEEVAYVTTDENNNVIGQTLSQKLVDKLNKEKAEKERVRVAEAEAAQSSMNDEQSTNAKNKEAADTRSSIDDEQSTNAKKIEEQRNNLIN